jgi:RNA polymerase sigma-70 factor (ECF subfamily)
VVVPGFEEFFRREHPKLIGLAIALVGDRELARDCVQEALLRTFNAWPKVAALERPGAWTRRVLINITVDTHRRRGREQAFARSVTEQIVETPDPRSTTFWNAVRALPDLQRACVALHYMEDRSIEDVAAVLGVRAGSVKSSLSRARSTLAVSLKLEDYR